MQLQTYLKNIGVTPKKLRFLLPEIKKLTPVQAVNKLLYSRLKSGQVLYKAIQSSIANAKNVLKCDPNLLKFKVLTVEQGQKLKRYLAGSRGSAKPIARRYSHIKIILEVEEKINSQVVDKKVEDKKIINNEAKKEIKVKSKTKSSNAKSNETKVTVQAKPKSK